MGIKSADTIAAVATALSESGIGIIRISGPEAFLIADLIFCTPSGKKILNHADSHTVHYGYITEYGFDGEFRNNIIDEVLVSVFRGPRSYTAEDTVEINCHGGVLMMNRILENVLKAGARLAHPGEFTKRAFLNGRIDLSGAEAVMDIIRSKSDYALKNSVRQLKGSVYQAIKDLRSEILYEIAFIESALDDPEHISLDGYPERLSEKNNSLIRELSKLIDSAENGRVMKEGIRTVIVGKPNAGKSSLLNLLAGEERAIVTEIAGTTRDVLEEQINLHGIILNVIDTAGIRETEDVVEKIGVDKARKYASDADLIVYVVDSSVPLDENDIEIINIISSKRSIILLNKTDLEAAVTEEMMEEILSKKGVNKEEIRLIKTSIRECTGLELFEDTVKDMFFHGEISVGEEVCITNMRHKEALIDARESLYLVESSLVAGMPEDFYSIDLMSAYTSLGFVIGEEVDDDLVNEIFSKFCMGK